MAKIILAEDSASVREAVSTLLQAEFHSVLTAANGRDAVDLYWMMHPDVLILDVMMPQKSGFDVCREIRAADAVTPILFLSAKTSEADKVLGLGLGGDDYLVKPFGAQELLARVAALLRRVETASALQNSARTNFFRIGEALVSGAELVLVTADGQKIPLTRREFLLLKLLRAHLGQVVPKDEIVSGVWGVDHVLRSRTLEQHLYTLRRKTDGNGFSIVTVRGGGLRLEAQTERNRT